MAFYVDFVKWWVVEFLFWGAASQVLMHDMLGSSYQLNSHGFVKTLSATWSFKITRVDVGSFPKLWSSLMILRLARLKRGDRNFKRVLRTTLGQSWKKVLQHPMESWISLPTKFSLTRALKTAIPCLRNILTPNQFSQQIASLYHIE
jgi:hypothetical protein